MRATAAFSGRTLNGWDCGKGRVGNALGLLCVRELPVQHLAQPQNCVCSGRSHTSLDNFKYRRHRNCEALRFHRLDNSKQMN